ncbi:MAG: alpha/beta hydrolase [Longibaculum sp.]
MAKFQCNVISYTLKRTIDIDVILPSISIPESLFENIENIHHDYSKKLPVLYLLHGFGNNHAQWSGYTNIELYAEERQIAVVMISGENKSYIDSEYDQFARFIQDELPEFITQVFPISNKKEDTYIAGLSMGGFGALYNGLSKTDQYQAIGAFSPAIEMENNPINLYEMIENKKMSIPIYLTCGENDFVYQSSLKFLKYLKERNNNVTWISEPNYAHEWRFWDLCVERFLDWLPRTDEYKDTHRKI